MLASCRYLLCSRASLLETELIFFFLNRIHTIIAKRFPIWYFKYCSLWVHINVRQSFSCYLSIHYSSYVLYFSIFYSKSVFFLLLIGLCALSTNLLVKFSSVIMEDPALFALFDPASVLLWDFLFLVNIFSFISYSCIVRLVNICLFGAFFFLLQVPIYITFLLMFFNQISNFPVSLLFQLLLL